MNTLKTDPKAATALIQRLTDDGNLIESGWLAFAKALHLEDAPAAQLTEMRRAFFGGAVHVFYSLLSFLEAGEDATEADLKRMDKVHEELDRFHKELEALIKTKNL